MRRTAPDGVYVWVAFSEDVRKPLTDKAGNSRARHLALEIYAHDALEAIADLSPRERREYAIGSSQVEERWEVEAWMNPVSNLHIYLLRARPAERTFRLGEIFGYEVYVVEESAPIQGEKPRMQWLGLCDHLRAGQDKEATPIALRGYSDDPSLGAEVDASVFDATFRPSPLIAGAQGPAFPFPTFTLASAGSDLAVWAGSCLKLHGEGNCASLLMHSAEGKDGALNRVARDLNARPSALVLLGDQLYADDVSNCLLERIGLLRGLLVGGDGTEELPSNLVPLSELTTEKRREYVGRGNVHSPFSLDEEADNQLFTLGEFCAYHLMHYNAALWPPLDANSAEDNKRRDEVERLLAARIAIRDYAAVLANVPTYCLPDDHEVTDDWFFDAEWIQKCKASPIASFITANGLYAWLAFQGAGNDPESLSGKGCTTGGAQPLLDPPVASEGRKTIKWFAQWSWSFRVPTTPSLLCLETRIRRNEGAPEHTPSAAKILENVGPYPYEVRSSCNVFLCPPEDIARLLGDTGPGCVIFTPAPVLGSDGIERAKPGDALESDSEGWRENLSNYFMLVGKLLDARVSQCTFVSGDVHYGYRREARVEKRRAGRTIQVIDLVQVVCSPMLNEFRQEGSLVRKVAERAFDHDTVSRLRYLLPATADQKKSGFRVQFAALPASTPDTLAEYYEEAITNTQAPGLERKLLWRNHYVELTVAPQGGVHVRFRAVPARVVPRRACDRTFDRSLPR